jgi:hypothetical protein
LVEILPEANPYAQLYFYRRDNSVEDNDDRDQQRHEIIPAMVVLDSHSYTTILLDDDYMMTQQQQQRTIVRSCDSSSSSLPTSQDGSSWDSVDSDDDDGSGSVGNDEATAANDNKNDFLFRTSSPNTRSRGFHNSIISSHHRVTNNTPEWVDWFGWDDTFAAVPDAPIHDMEDGSCSFPDTWLLDVCDNNCTTSFDENSDSMHHVAEEDAVCGRRIRSVLWTHHRRAYHYPHYSHRHVRYIHNNRTNKHNRTRTESASNERVGRYISLA